MWLNQLSPKFQCLLRKKVISPIQFFYHFLINRIIDVLLILFFFLGKFSKFDNRKFLSIFLNPHFASRTLMQTLKFVFFFFMICSFLLSWVRLAPGTPKGLVMILSWTILILKIFFLKIKPI